MRAFCRLWGINGDGGKVTSFLGRSKEYDVSMASAEQLQVIKDAHIVLFLRIWGDLMVLLR